MFLTDLGDFLDVIDGRRGKNWGRNRHIAEDLHPKTKVFLLEFSNLKILGNYPKLFS